MFELKDVHITENHQIKREQRNKANHEPNTKN